MAAAGSPTATGPTPARRWTPGARATVGSVAAAILAQLVLVVAWTGLYREVGSAHLVVLCGGGSLPALAALLPRARTVAMAVAALVAIPVALALATRGSLWDLIALEPGAWSTIGAILPDGLAAGSDSSLPVSPVDEPALVALLDIALAVLSAGAAWQIIVRRRPVLGVVVVGIGLAYRWTVEPPTSGAAAGAWALAALTVALALAAGQAHSPARPLRHLFGAVILGGVTVVVAAGLGAGPAQADDAWWAWKRWDIGASGDTSGGGLDIRQRYGALDWPSTPRVAFTVATDRPRPLRAISLDEFDGIAFTDARIGVGGSQPLPFQDGTVIVPTPVNSGPRVVQDIALVSATSSLVLASGRPERITGPFTGTADLLGDAIRLESPLRPGDRYIVRTRIPQPTPANLVDAGPYDPRTLPTGSIRLRPNFRATPVDTPPWGSAEPDPGDASLGPYARTRDLARTVIGDAATPYAAVNRVEAYLRRNFVYDEQPPYPTSLPDDGLVGRAGVDPPLVDFLLNSRRGFCQQFAGSMAVMLRSVGIPARVAVGYTGGRYDAESERYRVLDRDAHSWVEVWFPQYGWLPFDPTPGRSAPNPASVSSPDYAPTSLDIDLGGIADAAIDASPSTPATTTPTPDPVAPTAGTPPAGTGVGGLGWRWALLGLGVPLVIAPARRALRRLRGRRGGDERSRVIAATHELEASLAPLGWAPSPAASPSERSETIRARTGVDASALYRRAALARFAPDPPRPGEAAAAWRELATIRRAIHRAAPRRRRLTSTFGIPMPTRDTVG